MLRLLHYILGYDGTISPWDSLQNWMPLHTCRLGELSFELNSVQYKPPVLQFQHSHCFSYVYFFPQRCFVELSHFSSPLFSCGCWIPATNELSDVICKHTTPFVTYNEVSDQSIYDCNEINKFVNSQLNPWDLFWYNVAGVGCELHRREKLWIWDEKRRWEGISQFSS